MRFNHSLTFPADFFLRIKSIASFTLYSPTVSMQVGVIRPSSKNCNTSSPA